MNVLFIICKKKSIIYLIFKHEQNFNVLYFHRDIYKYVYTTYFFTLNMKKKILKMRTPDWLICIPSFHIIENWNSNCYSQYNENHCNVEVPLIRIQGLGYLVVVIGKFSASLSVDDVVKILITIFYVRHCIIGNCK